jgi:hypothetical protein
MNTNKPELPIIGNHRSEVITGVDRGTYTFEVTDTAVQLLPPNGEKFTRIGIENPNSNSQSIFIGGDDVENGNAVLAAGQTRGRELQPGMTRDEDTSFAPYAIAPDGETVYVVVEWSV